MIQVWASYCSRQCTYRQAADMMNLLCSFNISHTTVHTMAQCVAEHIQDYEACVVYREPDEVTVFRRPERLFINADGVMVKSQTKGHHHTIHKAVIHESVALDDPRRSLINSMIVTSHHSSEDLFNKVSLLLASHYRLNHTIVVTNSDGDSGYEYERFELILGHCQRHEHFRDRFHVYEMIRRRLRFDRELYGIFERAVKQYNWNKVEVCFDTAMSRLHLGSGSIEAAQESLRLLRHYLEKNWPYIQPMCQCFSKDLGGLGVCETTHRSFTYRMKRQGRNGCEKGLSTMTTLIRSMKNGYFEIALKPWQPSQRSLDTFIEVPKDILRQALKKTPVQSSCGVLKGRISNDGSISSAMGCLVRGLRL